MTVELRLSDWYDYIVTIPDKSIDLIATDLPYGITACKWDSVIPFEPMWEQVKRVLKERGAFVTTASQPFTSALVMSNVEWFKYEWVWEKGKATGHVNCNKFPMKSHENIVVFCNGQTNYFPQMTSGKPYKARKNPVDKGDWNYGRKRGNDNDGFRYPRSVIKTKSGDRDGGFHPTQKPVALYEYLIKTYTNEGDTVMDFCFGSGTTAVACVKTGRNFTGCDNNPEYFAIAEKRIAEAQLQMRLPI